MSTFYGKYNGLFGGGGTGGGGGGSTFSQGVPAGAVPGSTFTLSSTPDSPDSVLFFVDGALWYQNSEYTISGATITTLVPLEAGQLPYAYFTI